MESTVSHTATTASGLSAHAPNVALAPMAGITDAAFRRVALDQGADWVVSEMVATRGWFSGQADMVSRAAINPETGDRTVVQIAGCEAGPMADMAQILVDHGAARIDINMGCPAKKVTKQGKASGASGSALMRVPDHALALVDAVVGAVSVPVSIKMRLGWDHDTPNAPEIARQAARLGVRSLAVHGRTRQQFYKGHADWRAVNATVAAVDLPVLVNGDIACVEQARRALAFSGAAGVMVGRAAVGQPWLLGQIKAAFAGQPIPTPPQGQALGALIASHFEAALCLHGAEIGLRSFRKHLAGYAAACGVQPPHHRALVTQTDPAQLQRLIAAVFADAPGPQPAKEAA